MLLIDGTAFIHRAYHGLFYKENPMPLSAVLGTVRMLRKLLETYQPTHAAIALDSAGSNTFRHQCYPAYKQKKKQTPEDFKTQLPYAALAVQALGLRLFNPSNWEADDVLASLAFWGQSIGQPVTVVSSDKDLLQLVCPGIKVFDPRVDKFFDDQAVQQKLGVLPRQIPDYLGLVGDSSDNIPGVKRVGPKTALKLLAGGLTLEQVFAKAEQSPDANPLYVKLLAHKSEALLSKYLATLRVDVDLGTFTIDDLRLQEVRSDVLNNMLPNSGWDR